MITENTFTFTGTLIGEPKLSKKEGKPPVTRVNIKVGDGFNTNKIPLIAFGQCADDLSHLTTHKTEILVKGRVESRKRSVKIEVQGEDELRDMVLTIPSFVVNYFKLDKYPTLEDDEADEILQ